jgi:hypothetical protein
LEGAVAYLVGVPEHGLKQMLEQVNLSRLSHAVRAAGMMRRCLNEALCVARHRVAFSKRLIAHPLLRRQLIKLMIPAEQALSMVMATAAAMGEADAGSSQSAELIRILTPLVKFRACRDNLAVATGAMEVRGGNGYIEEWVNARLVRDAQIGVLWEGTSNINALDVVVRAVGKVKAHHALGRFLHERLRQATLLPPQFAGRLQARVERALVLAERVARGDEQAEARRAASALYHAASAVLLAWEGTRDADAGRTLVARCVLEHRLAPRDPLGWSDDGWEARAIDLLLDGAEVPPASATALLAQ